MQNTLRSLTAICLLASGLHAEPSTNAGTPATTQEKNSTEKKTEQAIAIDSKKLALLNIPESFHSAHEEGDTLFLMPRKDDLDGPVSMRFTVIEDLEEKNLTDEQILEFTKRLQRLNKGAELKQAGKNTYSTRDDVATAPDGTNWIYKNYAIIADKMLITATVQTVKGREKEPQCAELEKAIPAMLKSLSRNPKP